jgi:hypothetical protein
VRIPSGFELVSDPTSFTFALNIISTIKCAAMRACAKSLTLCTSRDARSSMAWLSQRCRVVTPTDTDTVPVSLVRPTSSSSALLSYHPQCQTRSRIPRCVPRAASCTPTNAPVRSTKPSFSLSFKWFLHVIAVGHPHACHAPFRTLRTHLRTSTSLFFSCVNERSFNLSC